MKVEAPLARRATFALRPVVIIDCNMLAGC